LPTSTLMPLTRSETRRAPRLVNSARTGRRSRAPRERSAGASTGGSAEPLAAVRQGRRQRRLRLRRAVRPRPRSRRGRRSTAGAAAAAEAGGGGVASGGGKSICQTKQNRHRQDGSNQAGACYPRGLGLQEKGQRRPEAGKSIPPAPNGWQRMQAGRRRSESRARTPVRAGPGGRIRNRSGRSGRPGARAARASACSPTSSATRTAGHAEPFGDGGAGARRTGASPEAGQTGARARGENRRSSRSPRRA
jgi:hypothetical protein